jgi:phospholipase C
VRPSLSDSEHPGYDIKRGEQWTVKVVNAIMRSGAWSSTAILITWDDSGDVIDHVTPPVVERSETGKVVRYGLRVPLIVLSPFTTAAVVSHQVLSHVSTLRFIEDLFHLEALTFRDQTAIGLTTFFDYSKPGRSPFLVD